MSAQTLTFTVEEARITVSDTGVIERVEHATRTGENYVAEHSGLPRMIIDGRAVDWRPAGVITDEDEVETRYAAADRPELECTIRNGFAGSWLQRCMVINTSSQPIEVEDVITEVSPAAQMTGRAGMAAADTYWFIQPTDGAGPLLTGRLSHGAVTERASDGFRTGPIQLRPGHRFVLQWVIEFVPYAIGLAAKLSAGATVSTALWQHESFPIHDPDTAVLVPDPLLLEHEEGTQVIGSPQPGRFGIELRSARGSRRMELAWVPRIEDLLVRLSLDWLFPRRAGSQAPILPGSGAALGLQYGLGARLTELPEAADEALIQHTSRLLDRDQLSSHDIACLAQESLRTGDPDPLDRAHTELLTRADPVPGLGLAATRVCLAELATGSTPQELLDWLYELSRRSPNRIATVGAHDLVLNRIAAWELAAVTGPADTTPSQPGDQHASSPDLLPGALRLAAQVGSGLPGHRLGRPAGLDTDAYCAAVLDLVPEHVSPPFVRRCGCTPGELAERTHATSLAAVLWPSGDQMRDDDQLNELIGWVVLGRPAAPDV